MKRTLDEINGKLTLKKKDQLKIATETAQNKTQRKKYINEKTSVSCGATLSGLTYIQLESPNERREGFRKT